MGTTDIYVDSGPWDWRKERSDGAGRGPSLPEWRGLGAYLCPGLARAAWSRLPGPHHNHHHHHYQHYLSMADKPEPKQAMDAMLLLTAVLGRYVPAGGSSPHGPTAVSAALPPEFVRAPSSTGIPWRL